MLLRLSAMPVAFLGVGVYRAWIASFFRFGAYPGMTLSDYAVFETSIGVVSLAAALLARRIVPMWSNRRCLAVCGASMTLGSVLLVAACFGASALGVPADALGARALKTCGLVLAGGGCALIILLWCEFYGALNPMRVAVYHAASILAGELGCWVLMGLDPAWVAVFSCVLPAVSLGWAHRSVLTLPAAERPHPGEVISRSSVPVKPIALMAVCSFAMQFATMPGQPMVAGNIVGTLFACAFVIAGSLSTSRWFNFDTIYRVAFPFICATCLLVTPLITQHAEATALFFDAGYTMLSMFIMIVLSNITYRFGINAVWLNGIERAARYIMESLGWVAYLAVDGAFTDGVVTAAHLVVALGVFVAFLVIVLPEKSLGALWGIDLHEDAEVVTPASGAGAGAGARPLGEAGAAADPVPTRTDPFSPGRLAMRVSDVAREHALSDREEEVLQLMARKVSVAQMEESLFVARGTIKAHTGRIYKKLGVHSRAELFALLGVDDDEPAGQQAGE